MTTLAQQIADREQHARDVADARRLERICRSYLHRDMPDAYILLVLAAHGFGREDLRRLHHLHPRS